MAANFVTGGGAHMGIIVSFQLHHIQGPLPHNVVLRWDRSKKDVHCLFTLFLFFLLFPYCRGEAGHLLLILETCFFKHTVSATFVIFPMAPCCLPFPSTFRPALPDLDLSSHSPPILVLVVCCLHFSLSQIFSVISRLSFSP